MVADNPTGKRNDETMGTPWTLTAWNAEGPHGPITADHRNEMEATTRERSGERITCASNVENPDTELANATIEPKDCI